MEKTTNINPFDSIIKESERELQITFAKPSNINTNVNTNIITNQNTNTPADKKRREPLTKYKQKISFIHTIPLSTQSLDTSTIINIPNPQLQLINEQLKNINTQNESRKQFNLQPASLQFKITLQPINPAKSNVYSTQCRACKKQISITHHAIKYCPDCKLLISQTKKERPKKEFAKPKICAKCNREFIVPTKFKARRYCDECKTR